MRKNLKEARKKLNLTQENVAGMLGINIRYYKSLESAERLGSIKIWDDLEDLLGVNQRKLREISENHLDQANNQ